MLRLITFLIIGLCMTSNAQAKSDIHEYRVNISYGSKTAVQLYVNDKLVSDQKTGPTGFANLFLNPYLKPGANTLRVVASSPEVPITTQPPVVSPAGFIGTSLDVTPLENVYVDKGDRYELTEYEDPTHHWHPANASPHSDENLLPHIFTLTITTPSDFDPRAKPQNIKL